MTGECSSVTKNYAKVSSEGAANDETANEIFQILKHYREDVEGIELHSEMSQPCNSNEETSESSDSEEDDEKGEHENTGLQITDTIYPGHSMSIHTSLLLIWGYVMTFSLTGEQLSGLLTLVSLHCLTIHPALKSLKRFKSYFAKLHSPLKKHYFCAFCITSVLPEDRLCPNNECLKNLEREGNKCCFIELSIMHQLNEFYKRNDFLEAIKHRCKRRKTHDNHVEDIYDGATYKRMSAPGMPLSDAFPYNISFTWNTDGLPLFKSSKMGIWPLYLMVNELPYKMRKKKENMIFYGLWFGNTKPVMSLFSKPLFEVLKVLEDDGISVTVGGTEKRIHAFLICGSADLPAKSSVMNMIQFNGKYSCSTCLQTGETCKIGLRGHCHIFPFCEENPDGPQRSKDATVQHAIQATVDKKSIFGIKGPSFLMTLKSYDYIHSFGIDYMHGVLLGVTKTLLKLWFTSSHKGSAFSVADNVHTVDTFLHSIKPPHNITRRPRSLSEHLSYWKASELRSWLFYYSVPVLKSVLSPVYFIHFCTLAEAIWILCGDSISERDIQHSKILLNYFVYMMSKLYEPRFCTLNVHQLLHLPDCVKNNGPLWAYSCFAFESINGELLKLFHGTQNVDTQIVVAMNMHQMLSHMMKKLDSRYHKIPFVQKMLTGRKLHVGLQLNHNLFAVGKEMKAFVIEGDVIQCILNTLHLETTQHLTVYARILLRGEMYHSMVYNRVTARNSYTVKYLDISNGLLCFGFVKYYIIHRKDMCECNSVCNCAKNTMACVIRLEETSTSIVSDLDVPAFLNLKVSHIHVCSERDCAVIPISNILQLCVAVNLGDNIFVCEMPNCYEGD